MGVGGELLHDDLVYLLAADADIESGCGVLDAYALEVVVNSLGIVGVNHVDAADLTLHEQDVVEVELCAHVVETQGYGTFGGVLVVEAIHLLLGGEGECCQRILCVTLSVGEEDRACGGRTVTYEDGQVAGALGSGKLGIEAVLTAADLDAACGCAYVLLTGILEEVGLAHGYHAAVGTAVVCDTGNGCGHIGRVLGNDGSGCLCSLKTAARRNFPKFPARD